MSARELVKAQRAAFLKGCAQVGARGGWSSYDDEAARVVARSLYPLPKVTRPRVVSINLREYRILNSELWWRYAPGYEWEKHGWTRRDAQALLGLFADPTETVDAE